MSFTTLPLLDDDQTIRVDIPRTPGHRGKLILKVLRVIEEADRSLITQMQPYMMALGNTWFIRELDRTQMQTSAMANLVQYCQSQLTTPDKNLDKYYDYLQSTINLNALGHKWVKNTED